MPYNPHVRQLFSWRMLSALAVAMYLCCAGWFFLLAPWSRFWGTAVVTGAPFGLIGLIDSPALRGALSGFGLVHFPMALFWLQGAMQNEAAPLARIQDSSANSPDTTTSDNVTD